MDRTEFREVLQAKLDSALMRDDTRTQIKLTRLLRNKRALKRVHKRSQRAADKRYGGSIMDWLMDGGWEKLLSWIMAIINTFSKSSATLSIVFCLLASIANAQGLQVEAISNVTVIKVSTKAATVRMSVEDVNRNPIEATRLGDGSWTIPATSAKRWVRVLAIDFDRKIFDERILVVGGGPGPDPQPDPGPSPPPTPTPDPDVPPPIPGDGLKVAMIVESSLIPTLRPGQQNVLYSTQIRLWLNSHCRMGTDGNPSWRVLDPDAIYTDPNGTWAQVAARPRKSVPWIVISNGKTGYEGPLPESIGEAMTLLERFDQ